METLLYVCEKRQWKPPSIDRKPPSICARYRTIKKGFRRSLSGGLVGLISLFSNLYLSFRIHISLFEFTSLFSLTRVSSGAALFSNVDLTSLFSNSDLSFEKRDLKTKREM